MVNAELRTSNGPEGANKEYLINILIEFSGFTDTSLECQALYVGYVSVDHLNGCLIPSLLIELKVLELLEV